MSKLCIGRRIGIAELALCLLMWTLALVLAGACFNKPVRLATKLAPAPATAEQGAISAPRDYAQPHGRVRELVAREF